MLTEVGHGLDARNIETTATRMNDGSFDLHTPSLAAAKSMPPTTPYANMPRVAVVFAQLIVHGGQRGIRPFLVRLNSAKSMARGVTSHLLPTRPGANELDHAITTFDHVRLNSSALLGEIDAPKAERAAFFQNIHRVTVGTLSLSMVNIAVLRMSAYILGRYSQKRRIGGHEPHKQVPIITFSTQHTPIVTALTFASVLEAFAESTTKLFTKSGSPQIRSALAAIFKHTATSMSQPLYHELMDRCGWQGLYNHNQMFELASAVRGNSVAEGDSLVLCIRK